nr:copper chaperone PCu(A)C [Streptomonospora sp. PA3]
MLAAAAACLTAAALSACGAGGGSGAAAPSPAASTARPAAGGDAQPDKGSAARGDIQISGAWMPEPARPDVGAAYLTIRNSGEEDDALVGAATTASQTAEIHTTKTADSGASVMSEVEEVPVPAGGTARLEPGGYHLMIMGISDTPAVGDTVTLTLEFAGGTEVEVDAPVLERAQGR